LDNALNEAIKLTDSKIGYIYFYSEKRKEFTLNTWSKEVMKECAVVNPQTVYSLDKTGIWGEAVRQRKSILVNDFPSANPLKKGTPEGHVRLSRFLTVPLFQDGEIVAVVGVANKDSEYDDTDILQLNLLMDAVWKTTSRLKAESSLKENEERLRQAEKMEAIGHLAGGIAHDFNNILGGIVGFAEMSLDHTDKDSILERNIRQILKASNRAKNLVRQILTYSRQGKSEKHPTNIRQLAYEVVELLRAVIPSTVIIDVNLDMQTKPVLADANQIHEMILNLANNAVYAMQNKGTLRVNLRTEENYSAIIGIGGTIQPGEYSIIEVIDTGCGMDAATIEKAFNPFYTTKPVGEGTGMGLSVVLGVVHSHDGGIQVVSAPGAGTTFRIFLPVENSITLDSNSESEQKSTIPGGTETILFVDDEQMLVELFSEMLTDLGYRVVCRTDGRAAVEYLKSNAPEIDIVVSDQTMPYLNGLELAEEAHKIRRDLPIVICSGYSRVLLSDKEKDAGVSCILAKPVSLKLLSSAIRNILDSRNHQNL
ncbi:MAG: GAF domain-containing protein, partial [Fibrobacteres bacterium]|nr:GAF domain-containing protein [Fibrobacterota bacterium]